MRHPVFVTLLGEPDASEIDDVRRVVQELVGYKPDLDKYEAVAEVGGVSS